MDDVNLFRNGKQIRFLYLLRAAIRNAVPRSINILRCRSLLSNAHLSPFYDEICSRVDYYNKLSSVRHISSDSPVISDHKLGKGGEVYYIDTQEYLRFFNGNFRWRHIPGDVTEIPDQPTIVKSRPVNGDNSNSVLLNLNKIRHFVFVRDHLSWNEKHDKAVFRGKIYKKDKRLDFFAEHFGNPICDLGDTSHHSDIPESWHSGRMTIEEQLKYKFILSIEGNDVASNLKWIMASNSIAVMPRPEYETWFMEGRLVPGMHYIEIRRDYSDLEEKLNYYIANPDKAGNIIRAAHRYVERFQNPLTEKIASLMVLDKYFSYTNFGP